MRICSVNNVNFQRRLKPSEEAEYRDVLSKAQNKGKKILIVPASSLPNQTGVGNIGSKEGLEFFDFAKKYWGINEIQLLPIGQYHVHGNTVPIYSGTSMDLGNHVINLENYTSEIPVSQITDRVDFKNVITPDSPQEKILKKLYKEGKFQKEFENFKNNNQTRLEPKALYRALRELNETHDYKKWNEIDKNLFELPLKERETRISEIKRIKAETIDFYYFKQFLAEDSLNKARQELNKRDLKLNADMLCGFSYDEVWANPKAFHKNTKIRWNLPALDFDSPEGEKLLREKIKFFTERFDGFRVDASWTYASQPLIRNNQQIKKDYADKMLNIIDDEASKIKGKDYLKNIMHEFATSSEDFNIYNGNALKPYVKNRVKIYTSDYLSESWGSNYSFLKRGWNPDSFIIGAANHDSPQKVITETQIQGLSKALGIKPERLKSKKEFIKAKLAEPMSAKNSMIYFMDALNIEGQFQGNADKSLNYAIRIPRNYQDKYFKSLEKGEAFNPMNAFEKVFKSKGLDKKEPELYKKIVKYKKILTQKEKQVNPAIKIACEIICSGLAIYGIMKYCKTKNYSHSM